MLSYSSTLGNNLNKAGTGFLGQQTSSSKEFASRDNLIKQPTIQVNLQPPPHAPPHNSGKSSTKLIFTSNILSKIKKKEAPKTIIEENAAMEVMA